MPHLPQGRIRELMTESERANCPGDYNAVFFMEMCRQFLKAPCYNTIVNIHLGLSDNSKIPELRDLFDKLCKREARHIIESAAELAFMEFYRLVAGPYETYKTVQNGVMPLLEDCLNFITDKYYEKD